MGNPTLIFNEREKMGKRKSKKKIMKKKKRVVATIFDCPFCNHSNTVECTMDRKKNLGSIKCRICGASYQMMINYLTEPVDVFSEWIDECQNANDPHADPENLDEQNLEDNFGDPVEQQDGQDFNEHQDLIGYPEQQPDQITMKEEQ